MRSIFYTLSALVLLVVVSLFVNIQHQWAKAQESSMITLYENEKLARAHSNLLGQLLPALATQVGVDHNETYVRLNLAFVSTVNNTDPDDQHFFHVLSNVHRYKEFVKMYGMDELGLDWVELSTVGFEDYLTNSSRSFAYTVQPYGFSYEWEFSAGLRDKYLNITRPGAAGDWVRITLSGGTPSSATFSCCTTQELEFGNNGNVTVRWAPGISLDFTKLDPTKVGVMGVNTTITLPATPERVKIMARGFLLNLTHQKSEMAGNTVFTG